MRPLRVEADYDRALAEIAPYFENPPRKSTPEANRFNLLAAAIETYEAKHWPIDSSRHLDQ